MKHILYERLTIHRLLTDIPLKYWANKLHYENGYMRRYVLMIGYILKVVNYKEEKIHSMGIN